MSLVCIASTLPDTTEGLIEGLLVPFISNHTVPLVGANMATVWKPLLYGEKKMCFYIDHKTIVGKMHVFKGKHRMFGPL